MSTRLRFEGYKTRCVYIAVAFRDGIFGHKGVSFEKALFDTRDIYIRAFEILSESPFHKSVRELSVSCFNLIKSKFSQLDIFEDVMRKEKLVNSVDEINKRWGDFVVIPARMLGSQSYVPDRIAFGGIKELEEFTLQK